MAIVEAAKKNFESVSIELLNIVKERTLDKNVRDIHFANVNIFCVHLLVYVSCIVFSIHTYCFFVFCCVVTVQGTTGSSARPGSHLQESHLWLS